MKYFLLSLMLLASQAQSAEDGNLIPEPTLSDYSQAQRQPGILGPIEEVQDEEGNPVTF